MVAPLRAQYQLRYVTLPEIQHRRLDVKVSLLGARVRIRPANADSLDECRGARNWRAEIHADYARKRQPSKQVSVSAATGWSL